MAASSSPFTPPSLARLAWPAMLFAAGLELGALFNPTGPIHPAGPVIAALFAGFALRGLAHDVLVTLAARLLSTAYGQRAVKQILADGTANLSADRITQ